MRRTPLLTTLLQAISSACVTVLLAGCSVLGGAPTSAPLPSEPPSPTPVYQRLAAATTSTVAPILTATPSGPTSTPLPTLDPCVYDPSSAPTGYDIYATIDMPSTTVKVTLQAVYRNQTGMPIKAVVMHVDPNRVPGAFTLDKLTDDGNHRIDSYTLTGPRLDIALKDTLAVGCSLGLNMEFTLKVLPLPEARLPYLGLTTRQLNLGNWLPQFAPFSGGTWYIPRAWTIGEYTVGEMGDYRVAVRVSGDPGLDVIGPGDTQRVGNNEWRFTLRAARSFTLSVAAGMSRLSATTLDGLQIDLYSFTDGQPTQSPDGKAINGPQHALEVARRAVEQFSTLLGKIPARRLVIVEGDFPDGMEFSGLVFVGTRWFKTYEGKADSWLTLITAHEVVHQWWYSLVANDQLETPFLDEGLAIYSEALFLEGHYPELVPWWWTFRVKIHQPTGYVDSKASEFSTRQAYLNAVYLRGASMLQEIRDLIGTEAFTVWLRRYTSDNTSRIATLTDFWAAMAPADYARSEPIRARYLRDPDPLRRMVTPTPPSPSPAG